MKLDLSKSQESEIGQIVRFIESGTEIKYIINGSNLELTGGDNLDYLQLGNYMGINEFQEPIVGIPLKINSSIKR